MSGAIELEEIDTEAFKDRYGKLAVKRRAGQGQRGGGLALLPRPACGERGGVRGTFHERAV